MGNPNYFVPNHIVEAILLKLPVRSLLRFKSVSNNFLSLISNPRFVSVHCQPSNAIPSSMIFQSDRKFSGAAPVLQVLDLITKKRQVLDLPHMDGTFELVGCANGLVCIRAFCLCDIGYKRTFMLWNPATKQYRHVTPCTSYPSTTILAVGFGYHSRIKDYKLFALPGNHPPFKYKPQVLELRRGTCREIDTCIGLRDSIYSQYSSPVVIAAVWYQARRTDSGPKILSFDFKEDSFALIDPPFFPRETWFSVALGVRDQKLCLFATSNYYRCRGWMMVEEASWIEMFTINFVLYYRDTD